MTLPTADVLAAVDADIDGSLERLFDWLRIPSISTGSLGLDVALGIGGLPKGRLSLIHI